MSSQEIYGLHLRPTEYNQALPVNWRWERARWLRESGKYARRRKEDGWVIMAKPFQAELAKATVSAAVERISEKYPGMYWAWRWYDNPQKQHRWTVEAYLCADEDPTLIAERVRANVETVLCYEKLFFNVRGKTRHWAYIMNEVIGPAVHHGLTDRQYDLLWKLFGLLKGAPLLDAIIRTEQDPGHMNSVQQTNMTMSMLLKSSLGTKALYSARTIPVAYNQQIILEAYNKMVEIEKNTDGSGQSQNLI